MEKSIHELKAEFVYLSVREKKNCSFEIIVIILRYIYNKCKFPIQKGF